MTKTRHTNPLRATAAMLVLAALAFTLPASGKTQAKNEGTSVNPTVARGMLIPARMRLIVRYSPSRAA